MKLYDISQELFTCEVFPGDEAPERRVLATIKDGSVCNLTGLSMCAHNGTHIDAPYHFCDGGKTVDRLSLGSLVGRCFVAFAEGALTAEKAEEIVNRAQEKDLEAAKRILIGGNMFVTAEAARVFAEKKLLLFGNESQTVGPPDAPAEVHRVLLGADVILLEGIRLGGVSEGVYLLSAAPLNLGGADGAPCRAVLIEE